MKKKGKTLEEEGSTVNISGLDTFNTFLDFPRSRFLDYIPALFRDGIEIHLPSLDTFGFTINFSLELFFICSK